MSGPLAQSAPALAPAALRCYVALGDSFTAGTGTAPGSCWADRLATSLRRSQPELVYRNLAQEGATSEQVLAQAAEAAALEPDLATVIAGTNDVLESVRPQPELAVEHLAEAMDRLERAVPGVLVVTATLPGRWQFVRMGPRTRARVSAGVAELNQWIRALAAERGIPCLDVAEHPGLTDKVNFCDDGLHPSELGHQRAAAAFARLLQSRTGQNGWALER